MSTNSLNAAISVDFSLIGTKLHAMYKKEANGYKILLIPTLQSDNEGVTIQELIDDIKSLTKSVTGSDSLNTEELTNALDGAVQESTDEELKSKKSTKANLPDTNNIRIILNMAYLYIDKVEKEEKSQIEYAFNLNILTTGLIPKALEDFVTIDHIGIAIWNTARTQILNQMSIVKIEDYLGLPETKDNKGKEDKTEEKPET